MCEDLYFWVSVKTGERFETPPNPHPFWILCETELQRKKPSVSDSYPWLLQSLDEPEPANVSRIKTEPDRQTQEFCHSVCHPFASEPNLCRSQKPPRWWGKETFSGWTSGCVTPPSATVAETSRTWAILVPLGPLRAFIIVLCAVWRGHHGNTKHINNFTTKDMRFFNKTFFQEPVVCLEHRIFDVTWYVEIQKQNCAVYFMIIWPAECV